MKKLVLAALVLMSTALSGSAFARRLTFHGTMCQPVSGNTTSVDYSVFGINNTSAGTVTIECPMPISYSTTAIPTIIDVAGEAYDRNTTSDVICTVQKLDAVGTVLASAVGQTHNGGPGSSAQNFGFGVVSGVAVDGYWRMRCTLPAVQSGAFCHLVSIVMNTSE